MKVITEIDDEMMFADKENSYIDINGIQGLLDRFGSFLREFYVDQKKFSTWLYDLCMEHGIEPIFALAMLQKESSLVQMYKSKPPMVVLDWCCGFGCPETGGRNPKYKGFAVQIHSMLDCWGRYKKVKQVKDFANTKVFLYDTKEWVLADDEATAMNLYYNPRREGIELLEKIWYRYYEECEKLNLLRG